MIKHVRFLIGLVMAFLITGTALAQDITPQHTDPTWQATYWNNPGLSGPPVLQRPETNLDYNWGTGSPAPGINNDQFSVRYLRYVDVSPGDYQIIATSDDGIRVWVDEELIINQWYDHGATTYTAQKYLGPGHHLIRVEYYENFGDAGIKLSWRQGASPLPPTPSPPVIYQWRGEYFNNKSLSGPPVMVRDDPEINFYWGNGSPAPGVIAGDGFSGRWSRNLDFPAGNYRFTMTVDDGARLFINGHLLIDAWKDQSPTTYTGDIFLPGGAVSAQLEYYQNTGGAMVQLAWAPVNTPPPPPLPVPPPSANAVGYVTAYRLNVRSGPGYYYPVMGWFYQNQPLRLLGRDNSGVWLKVEGGYNFRGWVYAYYIWSNTPFYSLPVIQ